MPGSSPKKSRKWIGSLLIITVLIIVIVLGTTTNLFGGFQLVDTMPEGTFAEDHDVNPKCSYKISRDAYFCADGCYYYEEEYTCAGAVYDY